MVWGGSGNALKGNITSGSYFRVLPPSPPVTAPGRPHHVPPPPAAAAPMSRKKSGFAITSVRGGSGNAPGDASGAATGSSSSSPGSTGGSRFRLVRLLSPGEVLRRGRWLCRDFYERDASPRGGGGGGRVPVSLDAPRAVPAPHQPRSLGAFAELVQQVRGRGLLGAGRGDHAPDPPPVFVYRRCPPNPLRHAQGAEPSSACAWDWLARRAKTRGEAGLPAGDFR